MEKVNKLIRLIKGDHNSNYWIRKGLVYGLTALFCVLAIIYALQKPYAD